MDWYLQRYKGGFYLPQNKHFLICPSLKNADEMEERVLYIISETLLDIVFVLSQ